MNFDWQNFVTLALVAAAAVYVIRRLRRTVKGKQTGACDTCSDCPQRPGREALISIDRPPKR